MLHNDEVPWWSVGTADRLDHNQFDLEDPRNLARLDPPIRVLEALRERVVIDELHRRQELLPRIACARRLCRDTRAFSGARECLTGAAPAKRR